MSREPLLQPSKPSVVDVTLVEVDSHDAELALVGWILARHEQGVRIPATPDDVTRLLGAIEEGVGHFRTLGFLPPTTAREEVLRRVALRGAWLVPISGLPREGGRAPAFEPAEKALVQLGLARFLARRASATGGNASWTAPVPTSSAGQSRASAADAAEPGSGPATGSRSSAPPA